MTGTGQSFGLMGRLENSFTATGRYFAGTLDLTILYNSGVSGTFEGELAASGMLDGVWSGPPPQGPYAITFIRSPGT